MDVVAGLPRFEKDQKLMKRISFLAIEWMRLFPDLDLKSEFAVAHQWCVMNDAKYKDHAKFLFNWIKRSQNRFNELKMVNRSKITTAKYIESVPQENDVMDASDWTKLKESLVRAKVARRTND